MNKNIAFFGWGLLIIALLVGASNQSGEDLFQKALRLERNEGKLEEAIVLYKQIVNETGDVSLAAKAQLRIGLCYEKLGQKSIKQAKEAFQKVIDNFPGQIEEVKAAKEKISNFLQAESAGETKRNEFNIRKIWSGPLTDTLGASSPDGKYISMVDWITGDLAVHNLESGDNRRLTHKGTWGESSEMALFSVWSPDGKKIGYNWLNKEECFDLRIVDSENPMPRILYPTEMMEYIHPFEWSPDGKTILVMVARNTRIIEIGLISVEDGSFRVLKTTTDEWRGNPPLFTFSPDGKYIAFSFLQEENTQNRDIFIMSVEDKKESVLIEHPMNDSLLGWTPDGKWILFSSDRTGSMDAWIVGVDQGEQVQAPEMIKKDLGFIEPMGFSKNGSFYYGVANQSTNVYTIDIDPVSGEVKSPPALVTQRYEGTNRSPDYSSDGKYLAYISTRGPRPMQYFVLCIRDMQTGEEKEIIPSQVDFNYPRWSPDGGSISVEGQDESGHIGIFRIDVQTKAVDPIIQLEPGSIIYSHRWSNDGRSIFYTRSDPDKNIPAYARKSHIYVHNISSGQDTILPGSPDDAKDIDISPDGQWLVFLNRDERRVLRVIATSGGESRDIYSFDQQLSLVTSPAWIAGGEYILFYMANPDAPGAETMCKMVRIPAKGGELENLELEMKEFRHFSVHPDGQHIVFHSTGTQQTWPEVWIMENFLPEKKKD